MQATGLKDTPTFTWNNLQILLPTETAKTKTDIKSL